jgi:pyridoxamine 5'-phosphate oxidase
MSKVADILTPLHAELGKDPGLAFEKWYQLAAALDVPNPNAMQLVTHTTKENAAPNCRTVLLKSFDPKQGFVFFTNYISDKSQELEYNAHCCLHFFWDKLYRQVKIIGQAEKVSKEESESYFSSRPRLSQVGAWSSRQSRVMKNRQEFLNRVAENEAKFSEGAVPCPPFWGGWRVIPEQYEFWKAHEGRLHERLRYTHNQGKDIWLIELLYP